MDAFVDRLTSEFRSRLWELIARSRPPEVSSDEEAERIYDQLCRRSRGDLAQHVEAYLFLAVADMLEAYDRQGQPAAEVARGRLHGTEQASDGWQTAPPGRSTTESASARGATNEQAIAESVEQSDTREALQTQLATLPAGVRSTLLLYRNYQMPLPEIARRLNVTVDAVQSQIKRGLLHCCLSRTKPPAGGA